MDADRRRNLIFADTSGIKHCCILWLGPGSVIFNPKRHPSPTISTETQASKVSPNRQEYSMHTLPVPFPLVVSPEVNTVAVGITAHAAQVMEPGTHAFRQSPISWLNR
jgi:hypothetical protein